jgi:hemoglobin/transferrin/lactoferrin receptor protein
MHTHKEKKFRANFRRAFGRTATFTVAPLAILPLMALAQATDRIDQDPQAAVANRAFEAITIMGEQEAQKTPWATQTDRQTLDDRQILNWSQLGSRAEPGLNFSTNTNSINIRGLDQTRVLTRIDGIRQPYLVDIRGSNGGVKGGLNAIDFNTLSGIDIVRGADSSTVGSGAMGGVVDVRSLSPDDLLSPGKAFGAVAKTGYYSVDNSWLLNTAAAGQSDNGFKWLVQAGVQLGHETKNMGTVGGYGATRSEPNPDNYTQQNYQLKLQKAFDGGHILGLTGSYFDRQDNITDMTANPKTYAPGQSNLIDKTNRQSVALNYAWASADNKSLLDTFSAQAYWQSVEVSSNLTAKRLSAPIGNYQRSNTMKENSYGLNLDASKSIEGDISQRWEFGGDWYGTNLTQYAGGKDGCTAMTNRFPPCSFFHNNQSDIPNTTGNQYALWAQNTVGFADGAFSVTPAIRYDYYEYSPSTSSFSGNPTRANLAANSGQAWSPKLLATWSATKEISFYAQYALSFNAPSATQLYSRFGSPGTYLVSGNPNLKPEKGRGWELGSKLNFQNVSGSLTYFDNRYDNFIESVSGPGTPQYPFFVQSFQNLEDVRIYGLEARGEWQFAQGWRTFASLAWTVGKDQSTGRYLNSVAPLQAIVGVGYAQSEWGATAQISAAAARTNVANPTASRAQPYPDFQAPGYGIVDLTAYWRPANLKGVSVQAGVFNVFNKTYWNALDVPTAGAVQIARPLDAYTQPGRNFAVSLTYQY